MKSILAITLIIISLILTLTITFAIFFRNTSQFLGIYDPFGKFIRDENIRYESSYFSWSESDVKILNTLKTEISKKRTPILTLEPWPISNSDSDVLKSTSSGTYDYLIDDLCEKISSLNKPVLIRWGHEMEINPDRYPWSGKNPDIYISAYQHFVSRCKNSDIQKNISYVWSPSGDKGSERYWPGKDFVDYIGVSVYSFDLWDKQNIGYQRSFQQIFTPKYVRLVGFNKPIIITELGVTGTEKNKESWMGDMFFKATFYKNLIGYVYFNKKDTEGAWGINLTTPDWTIDKLR